MQSFTTWWHMPSSVKTTKPIDSLHEVEPNVPAETVAPVHP